ncbi:endonuclease domain-containing protein [Sandaracinobacteroides saxicola]|uniref:DUF559 domain-containing protein n=1 Tax=Sandaracinobacteroides saxicola TaxID=2759707 RepID=A0A7G5IMS5_9SPHN|nr:endonuclease domain-containing protein [Sandaracinobacteroides saxicola]QMW24667.1 DUF559 domain-containing protein [Sandaracinobacteroides saxicola]
MSLPEVLLWRILRHGSDGVKFRRQHPFGPFVADFYCPAANLAIEIDGAAHDSADAWQRDRVRDDYFAANGADVVRLPAKQVLSDPVGTANDILRLAVTRCPLRQPCGLPPPPLRRGGSPSDPPLAKLGEVASRSDDGGGQ